MSETYSSKTFAFAGRVMVLTANVMLSCKGRREPIGCKALWDTGCTHTCITGDLAHMLGAPLVGETRMNTANGIAYSKNYIVDILIEDAVSIPGWTVGTFDNSDQGFDMLIGMDIITCGQFSISYKDKITTFSFRIPAKDHSDFTGELTEDAIEELRRRM